MKNTLTYFISLIVFVIVMFVFKIVTNKFDKRENLTFNHQNL